MKNLLEYILIHLVDNPDQVAVDEHMEENTHIYTLHVAPEDYGKVIGRQGRIINSIRAIARVRAVKENIHINVVLAEETAAPAVEA